MFPRTVAEWRRARDLLGFECPFTPRSDADCAAAMALGATGQSAARLVVANRILRVRLPGTQPAVRRMSNMMHTYRMLAPLGANVDKNCSRVKLSYRGLGVVTIQCVRDVAAPFDVDLVLSACGSEELDAMLYGTVLCHLRAAFGPITPHETPQLKNIVLIGRWPGTFRKTEMERAVKTEVRPRDAEFEEMKKSFSAFTAFGWHAYGGERKKCVFLFFPNGSFMLGNVGDAARASAITELLLCAVAQYHVGAKTSAQTLGREWVEV